MWHAQGTEDKKSLREIGGEDMKAGDILSINNKDLLREGTVLWTTLIIP